MINLKIAPKREHIVTAIIAGIFTIIAAVTAAFVTTDWFPDLIGIRRSEIHVERAVMYARILHFNDRRTGEEHFQEKDVGLEGSRSRRNTKLYDESLYLRAYYLRPHKLEELKMTFHSSGIVDVTALIPKKIKYDIDSYDKSTGHIISCDLTIKNNQKYILVATHYYNGYQYNGEQKRYESDGGFHVDYKTKVAIIVFDFTALNWQDAFKSEPKIFLRRGKEMLEQIPVQFDNGIIVSEPIKDPPKGSYIYCDWEWSTEKMLPPKAKTIRNHEN